MEQYCPKANQISMFLWEVVLPTGGSVFASNPLDAKTAAIQEYNRMQQTQYGAIPGDVGFMGFKTEAA
jgi:hypothetical protein